MENKKNVDQKSITNQVDLLVSKSYWYKIEYEECPMCGKQTQYKERQYTPKPKDYSERITFRQVYDYCMEIY